MEFSHFVDLFVLEDVIYFAPQTLVEDLAPFVELADSPLCVLPKQKLSQTIYSISEYTRDIYDAVPAKHSFSMKSYDYWVNPSVRQRLEEARSIPIDWSAVLRNLRQPGPRSYEELLGSCQALQYVIKKSLEELGKTRLTIMPSSRNLLPFLDVFHQMDTPALLIYDKITAEHRKSIEDILALTRPRTVYLPPLLSVLFSRCSKRSELPTRLMELRAEFADFRRSVKDWFNELDQASTIREKVEIRKDLDQAISSLLKHYEYKREGFYKQVAGAFVSAAEEGDLKKMLIKPAFAVLKEGMTNVLPDAISVRRFTGLIDLMDQALNVESYGNLLERLFGRSLDISQEEITEAKHYKYYIQTKYGVGVPLLS